MAPKTTTKTRTKKTPTVNAGAISIQKNLQKTEPSVPLNKAYPRAELGDAGTRILHGIIAEEYNSNLQGIEGIKMYDEMRKNDGTVRAAILAITLPIIRAKFFVNPATDDQEAKDVANFVEHALFDWLDSTWEDLVRQALLMIPFGVMLFEKVYETKDHEGKTYVTLAKLAPRLPKSILKWELEDRTFGIQQIRQDGVLAQIPGSKLLIFVNEREGDNWWGTSFLRGAYKHYYYKNTFYRVDTLAFERQGLGIPKVTMPVGYTESDEKKAANAMQNLRANEAAYLLLPNGYEAEFMNMGASTTRDPTNSINHHNKEILQSVLAQFLELGATKSGSGSRALSQDHSDLFLKALESVASNLISTINKSLIPELVDLNFSDISVYPVLDYSGISKVDIAALGTAYGQLVTAGAISPTNDDQQYLRAAMGLPARTQEDIESDANDDPSSEELEDHADIEDVTDDTVEEDAEKKGQTAKDNKTVDNAAKNKKPAPTDAKKKASHTHRFKRTFDDGKGFKSWRPLTFAEQKVAFSTIEDTMNTLQDKFTKDANDLLTKAKDAFMSKVHSALKSGDTKLITTLEIKFISDYKALVKDTMINAYEFGKENVAEEMGIAVPRSTASSLATIDLMADTIAHKTATDIETKAKIAVAHALKQDANTLQSAGAIDLALETTIATSVDITAGLIVSQAINNGRNDVFERNTAMIHSLQRSEILDEKTCNFCLSMDGLVIEPTDPWGKTEIYHGNCRGMWVEILKDEENPPEITGIPNKIGDYYGGEPNALVQPPKPIVRPGSLADKMLKEQTKK